MEGAMYSRNDPRRTAQRPFPTRPNRRDFLKLSALGAAAAAGSPAMAEKIIGLGSGMNRFGRGNGIPGRIAILHDTDMGGHLPTIDRDRVEQNILIGVRALTRINNTAAAFESLFPGLHSGSTIAIKVNTLALNNDTRWEVVRGIVSGLARMLGGTYDVSLVTIHDVQTTLSSRGYVPGEFTFNGNYPLFADWEDCSPTYYAYGSHRLSNFVLGSDYVINVPALKAHNAGYPQHEITTAFKNHYGSICPQNLCNNITGMLTLNADTNIRDKTCLVVTSALRGTYDGGPWEPAQSWNTFPESTPNSLFLTTDPTTEAYWARDMINAERVDRGLGAFSCPWVEQASQTPYGLGMSDPAEMTVFNFEPETVDVEEAAATGGLFLAPNVPNPMQESTALRFRLPESAQVILEIVEPSGRMVRRLCTNSFPGGYSSVRWDGRDSGGRKVAAGVYLTRLVARREVRTRRIVVIR